MPTDCAGSTDGGTECCGTAALQDNPDGAAFPHCVIGSLTSYCGKCKINVGLTCTSTENVQVCVTAADCPSSSNECCPVDGYNVCLSGAIATLAGIQGCLQ